VQAGERILDPPVANISTYQWTIPNNPIANYEPTYSYGQVTEISSYTTRDMLFYWWKPGTDLQVQCSVTVAGLPMTAITKFTVTRPTSTIAATFKNVVKTDNNWRSFPIDAIHFGDRIGEVGIRFLRTPIEGAGEWGWCQLINSVRRQRDAATFSWRRSAGAGLDTAFPYNVAEIAFATSDSPGM
jgi:hypothetical protein